MRGGCRACGGRWRELAVDRERGLQGDERTAVLNEAGEGVVEAAGAFGERAVGQNDLSAGIAHAVDSLLAHERVGVDGGDDHAAEAGGDEGVSAGAGAAVVGAGFERNVSRGAADGVAQGLRLLERDDFCVVAVGVQVRTFTEDAAAGVHQHAAHRGIG
jgi:hypothetical protein